MPHLADHELDRAEAALLSDAGEALQKAMFALSLGQTAERDSVERARKLGWVAPRALHRKNAIRLTDKGRPISDSLREYGFWLERDRRMPSSELVPALAAHCYAGKRVVEIGSGAGCNLLSLNGIPKQLVGVEPISLYRQMGGILAKMANLPTPETVAGTGRDLPLESRSFDIAFCYSAHQYMDIVPAFAEMYRVLKPGGKLVVVGNTLGHFTQETTARALKTRNLGTFKYDLTAILNTITYQAVQKRLLRSWIHSKDISHYPVYPARRFVIDRLERLGFSVPRDEIEGLPSGESVFFAYKK